MNTRTQKSCVWLMLVPARVSRTRCPSVFKARWTVSRLIWMLDRAGAPSTACRGAAAAKRATLSRRTAAPACTTRATASCCAFESPTTVGAAVRALRGEMFGIGVSYWYEKIG